MLHADVEAEAEWRSLFARHARDASELAAVLAADDRDGPAGCRGDLYDFDAVRWLGLHQVGWGAVIACYTFKNRNLWILACGTRNQETDVRAKAKSRL
jgi:hypothetical protein